MLDTLSEPKVEKDNLLHNLSFVNGEWVSAASGKTFDVNDPATGELITSVPDMNRDDVCKAIDAANDAWPAYRDLPAKDRANLMKTWFQLIIDHKEELARLMTR